MQLSKQFLSIKHFFVLTIEVLFGKGYFLKRAQIKIDNNQVIHKVSFCKSFY